MDLLEACQVIRQALSFSERGSHLLSTVELRLAVGALKTHLEAHRGAPIDELRISEEMAATPQGLRYLMPFVLAAEGFALPSTR